MSKDERHRLSRRRFLGAVGAGAGAVALDPVSAVAAPGPAVGHAPRPHAGSAAAEHFGRMFRLPAFAPQTPKVEAALPELGRPGGLLDAADPLAAGPKALIVDLSLSANNPNNPSHTAGTTFIGQFLDHDVTFDAASRLGRATNPADARNFRTPALDLDSVYGAGPVAQQELYDPGDHIKFKVESGGVFEDLPRRADGAAIVGDPRNDEHLIISGLHCAFLLFHNHAVDHVRAQGGLTDTMDVFAEARRLTTWHYHWLIVREFLAQIVGKAMLDNVLRHGRRWYRPRSGEAFMPVEFQTGTYRMGHSMVRPSYRANLAGDSGQPFFGFIFDPSQEGSADPDDLRGGARAARRFIGWQTFFDFGDGEVKPNKKIDTKISTALFTLPLGAIATHDAPTALPQRNLLRHLTWQLPSGQSIARAMGITPLAAIDLQELAPLGVGFERGTPLWYYVLKEAELVADGLHLGPVGGRIVAEVLIGLLQTDPASYLAAQPRWRPTLPSTNGTFRMTDFLTFAGVDPASRGQ
ncbi:MAG TPA: heme peroxidase family protein [Solirubrobacteraceae bacterium]|nr:heme peroxidase family protein [Solirubrobacteraceae bacterium]